MYVRHVGDSAYLNPIRRDGRRLTEVHEHVLLSRQTARMGSRPASSSAQCELTFAKAARWSRYERGHGAVPRSACRRTKTKEFPCAPRPDPGLECPRYSLWEPEGRKGGKALVSRSINDLPLIEAQQAAAAISLSDNHSFLPTPVLLVRFVLHFQG
ncbi:hypothetical protein EDD16DRAFT_1615001, partial [Pisolithus croceorrhizus]